MGEEFGGINSFKLFALGDAVPRRIVSVSWQHPRGHLTFCVMLLPEVAGTSCQLFFSACRLRAAGCRLSRASGVLLWGFPSPLMGPGPPLASPAQAFLE